MLDVHNYARVGSIIHNYLISTKSSESNNVFLCKSLDVYLIIVIVFWARPCFDETKAADARILQTTRDEKSLILKWYCGSSF